MNCYYSNLIEGHDTRPRDIARALVGDLDEDEGRRNLQIEAAAHVRVQEKIDRLAADDRLPEPASRDFIRWLHAEFYRDAPEAMLSIKSARAEFRMAPGEWRSAPEHDVAVGRHIPPSSRAVEPFMAHFERRYRFEGAGPAARILAMAAAHHRLNYIHPFPDGNGRVSRLMSHAMALKAGIGAHGLWSVSRGSVPAYAVGVDPVVRGVRLDLEEDGLAEVDADVVAEALDARVAPAIHVPLGRGGARELVLFNDAIAGHEGMDLTAAVYGSLVVPNTRFTESGRW